MSLAFQNYCQYIKDMNLIERETKRCAIRPDTTSTGLMTRLRHGYKSGEVDSICKDPFDVLFATLLKRRYRSEISFIIIYDIPKSLIKELDKDYGMRSNRITFTGFKKSEVRKWTEIDEDRRAVDIKYGENNVLHLWNKPYILEATTSYDKDFKKIWKFGELEYEGNNYGDTTDFYIIGTVERANNG